MITPELCIAKFGLPETKEALSHLVVFDVPKELEIGIIPKKIYCHKLMIEPLTKGFGKLIQFGFVDELKTWDGCYNPRLQRGSATKWSIHSWGLAFDVNAAWNKLGNTPTLSKGFVECFTSSSFDWGGNFGGSRVDGMHFQLSSL